MQHETRLNLWWLACAVCFALVDLAASDRKSRKALWTSTGLRTRCGKVPVCVLCMDSMRQVPGQQWQARRCPSYEPDKSAGQVHGSHFPLQSSDLGASLAGCKFSKTLSCHFSGGWPGTLMEPSVSSTCASPTKSMHRAAGCCWSGHGPALKLTSARMHVAPLSLSIRWRRNFAIIQVFFDLLSRDDASV